MKSDELIQLVQVLNPNKEPGKVSLITRYGAAKVAEILPGSRFSSLYSKLSGHIKAVKESGIPVLWVCDPCHGNTEATESGLKTRRVEKIISEIIETFKIHTENGSRYFELLENVIYVGWEEFI